MVPVRSVRGGWCRAPIERLGAEAAEGEAGGGGVQCGEGGVEMLGLRRTAAQHAHLPRVG